jgi:hypothetical protein
MGYLFAPAGSGVTGSAAETLTGSWVAMAAGIAPDIARKVRRERDVPGEKGYFILIQDRRRWFFLGNAERILICQHASQSQAARAAGFSPREYPGLPLAIRSGEADLTLRHVFDWPSAQFSRIFVRKHSNFGESSLRSFLTQSDFPVAPPAHLAPSSGHLSNAQPARAFVQGDVRVAHEDRTRGLPPNRRESIEIHTP